MLFADRGFHVIIITGRPEDQTDATAKNLLLQGIPKASDGVKGYDQLILRNKEEMPLTANQYKSARRWGLEEKEGYHIVGCIGDQISDCSGGAAGYKMKIPNYAYFLEWVNIDYKGERRRPINKSDLQY